MGALTLKSFPFELRGWDIEKFDSIDPTDGFGSNTRVYVSKNQIIQIEPDFNQHSVNNWLTDKGRHFFDSLTQPYLTNLNDNSNDNINLKTDSMLNNMLETILKKQYIQEHCNKHIYKTFFFVIAFENIKIEVLNMLTLLAKTYSFIKLRSLANTLKKNDLEYLFQLNSVSNQSKLNSSELGLLISTNTRYEGANLNLSLRQRFYKGNFKLLNIGPLLDLTFPISFLGSNLNTLKNILEGNNLACQDLKLAKNPILITNSNLMGKNNSLKIINNMKNLKYSTVLTKTWNGLNVLDSYINGVGTNILSNFLIFKEKDLINASNVYILNTTFHGEAYLNKILNLKLWLNHQNQANSILNKPSNSSFFEHSGTFINTEGIIKRTTGLISKKQPSRSDWQIFRRLLKLFNEKITFLDKKNNEMIFFNSKQMSNFKNFINFQYYATRSLDNLNFYLNSKNRPFVVSTNNKSFKIPQKKIYNTKLKYWLNDFYTEGTDNWSRFSPTLVKCSSILRKESTNFF